MDAAKEILDSLSQRISSPIIGYVITAFALYNVDPLLMMISEEKYSVKREYFVQHTDFYTLVIFPVLFGVAGALIAPWLTLLGAMWAELPTRKRRMLMIRSAHDLAVLRNKLREQLNQEVDAVIKSAKQDLEVRNIDDVSLREEVASKIDEIRSVDPVLSAQGSVDAKVIGDKYSEQAALDFIKYLEKSIDVAESQFQSTRAEQYRQELEDFLRRRTGIPKGKQ